MALWSTSGGLAEPPRGDATDIGVSVSDPSPSGVTEALFRVATRVPLPPDDPDCFLPAAELLPDVCATTGQNTTRHYTTT